MRTLLGMLCSLLISRVHTLERCQTFLIALCDGLPTQLLSRAVRPSCYRGLSWLTALSDLLLQDLCVMSSEDMGCGTDVESQVHRVDAAVQYFGRNHMCALMLYVCMYDSGTDQHVHGSS